MEFERRTRCAPSRPRSLCFRRVVAARASPRCVGVISVAFEESTAQIRDEKNMHLRNFYVIVPALTINFVEHSLLGGWQRQQRRHA